VGSMRALTASLSMPSRQRFFWVRTVMGEG
jgi:hypothetical protein